MSLMARHIMNYMKIKLECAQSAEAERERGTLRAEVWHRARVCVSVYEQNCERGVITAR